jgi:hypothetical protein
MLFVVSLLFGLGMSIPITEGPATMAGTSAAGDTARG